MALSALTTGLGTGLQWLADQLRKNQDSTSNSSGSAPPPANAPQQPGQPDNPWTPGAVGDLAASTRQPAPGAVRRDMQGNVVSQAPQERDPLSDPFSQQSRDRVSQEAANQRSYGDARVGAQLADLAQFTQATGMTPNQAMQPQDPGAVIQHGGGVASFANQYGSGFSRPEAMMETNPMPQTGVFQNPVNELGDRSVGSEGNYATGFDQMNQREDAHNAELRRLRNMSHSPSVQQVAQGVPPLLNSASRDPIPGLSSFLGDVPQSTDAELTGARDLFEAMRSGFLTEASAPVTAGLSPGAVAQASQAAQGAPPFRAPGAPTRPALDPNNLPSIGQGQAGQQAQQQFMDWMASLAQNRNQTFNPLR